MSHDFSHDADCEETTNGIFFFFENAEEETKHILTQILNINSVCL